MRGFGEHAARGDACRATRARVRVSDSGSVRDSGSDRETEGARQDIANTFVSGASTVSCSELSGLAGLRIYSFKSPEEDVLSNEGADFHEAEVDAVEPRSEVKGVDMLEADVEATQRG